MQEVKIEHNLGGWLGLNRGVGNQPHLRYGEQEDGGGKVQRWGPGKCEHQGSLGYTAAEKLTDRAPCSTLDLHTPWGEE